MLNFAAERLRYHVEVFGSVRGIAEVELGIDFHVAAAAARGQNELIPVSEASEVLSHYRK